VYKQTNPLLFLTEGSGDDSKFTLRIHVNNLTNNTIIYFQK